MLGIFLDTETTGLNPLKHSILEIAIKIVDVESGEKIDAYSAVIAQPQHVWEKADPLSLLVNGFNWEEVSAGKPPQKVAGEVITFLGKNDARRGQSVFICQNPSFDRAFFNQLIDPDLQEALNWPYHWLDLASMFWATEDTPWRNGVSKDKIAAFYEIPAEAKPHRAMQGVDHLIKCYEAVVGYPVAR